MTKPLVETVRELRELHAQDINFHLSAQSSYEALPTLAKVFDALHALLAAAERAGQLEERVKELEELVERAHHLAACVFKSASKSDYERARHNAAVLYNDIYRSQQNEANRRALSTTGRGT